MLLRIGVATLIGWMIAVGVYAGGLILGYEVSTETILAVFLATSALIALLARRIARLIVSHVAKILVDIDESVLSSMYPSDEAELDEEDLYMAWLLVDRVARAAAPTVKRVVLVVDSGEERYEYPPSDDLEEGLPRNVEAGYRVKAILYESGVVEIILSPDMVEKLARSVEAGGGEKAFIADEEVLIALYDIAKKTHRVVYDSPQELAAYAAYKAILRLAREDAIRVPPRLLDLLPFESHELREKIIAQVREEEEGA